MHEHFHSPLRFGALLGAAIALLSLPIFVNLGLYRPQGLLSGSPVVLTLLWCVFVPLLTSLGLWTALKLPLPYTLKHQFIRYGMVGVFNTLLNLALFNSLLFLFGIVSGPLIPVFSAISAAVVITVAFFLNKFFVFDAHESLHSRREYMLFFTSTSLVALLNVGIISTLINVVGAPSGIDPALWANIAVIVTVPISVLGNFLSYKFVVFKKHV